jgi:hypothetical protein
MFAISRKLYSWQTLLLLTIAIAESLSLCSDLYIYYYINHCETGPDLATMDLLLPVSILIALEYLLLYIQQYEFITMYLLLYISCCKSGSEITILYYVLYIRCYVLATVNLDLQYEYGVHN